MPVALIPDRDIPPAEAKALVGERKTENELTEAEIAARIGTLRRDVGDPVEAFIADSWTLEFDLALQPDLARSVHVAVQLAKSTSRRTEWRKKIADEAGVEYDAWKAAGLPAVEIAVKIYAPVLGKSASKAEVAEELAAILRARDDTPQQMRDRLPPYLVRALDYVTGGYVPGAPPFADPVDDEPAAPVGVAGAGDAAAPAA